MSAEMKRVEAALAHDLNNILQVIMGNLELMKRRTAYEPDTVDAALQATRHAAQLADRLGAIGRLQRPEPRSMELNRLLAELQPLFARTAGDRVRVELKLASDLRDAYADPHAVQVALIELATNARNAMPAGGRLSISTSNGSDGSLVIEVADTGAGMPPETLARVLNPRLAAEDERPAGLGLAIVQQCVRDAGGRVELSSTHLGTRVRLYLRAAN